MKGKKKYRKNFIIAMICAITLFLSNTFPAEAGSTITGFSKTKPIWGYINNVDEGSSLNVRQSPSLSAPIIGSLPAFSFVMVVGGTIDENEFVEVMYTTDGYYGYASANHIQFHGSSYYLVANVDSGNLNMRAGAGTSYTIKAKIPRLASFAYDAEEDNGWYRGIYGNARGYTSPEYTRRVGF